MLQCGGTHGHLTVDSLMLMCFVSSLYIFRHCAVVHAGSVCFCPGIVTGLSRDGSLMCQPVKCLSQVNPITCAGTPVISRILQVTHISGSQRKGLYSTEQELHSGEMN